MQHFKSKDVASIAVFSALWGILNSTISPIFFRVTGLPLLCDLVGFSVLTLTVWWVRKIGAASFVGAIATIVNFVFNPGGFHFLGFTAASIVFDALTCLIGYRRIFKSTNFTVTYILAVSTASAAVAGLIIGTFFMAGPALAKWGGVLGWAGLHALGGFIGGIIGVTIVITLTARGIHSLEGERRKAHDVK
ncbi:MAG: hypothetical protein QXQ41_07295 [Candidatus Bathyarchaeia archaeon]